jgi:hypothetical protein
MHRGRINRLAGTACIASETALLHAPKNDRCRPDLHLYHTPTYPGLKSRFKHLSSGFYTFFGHAARTDVRLPVAYFHSFACPPSEVSAPRPLSIDGSGPLHHTPFVPCLMTGGQTFDVRDITRLLGSALCTEPHVIISGFLVTHVYVTSEPYIIQSATSTCFTSGFSTPALNS